MDSAVAALRLVQQGRTLEAATVRSWPGSDRRSCCSPGALQRAARSAAHVGIPFQVLDLVDDFEAQVVAPFVAGYLAELLDGKDAATRLRTAVTTGAFACLAAGDWEGLPRRSEFALLTASEPVIR